MTRRNRPVCRRSAGSSLIVVRPKPHSAACTGSTGSPDSVATACSVTIHSPPGSFTLPFCTVCTALSRLAISVSSRATASALDSSALGPALRQTTPENGRPRSCACCQHLSQGFRIACPVERDAARHLRGQLVESGDQPGTAGVLGTLFGWWRRNLVPAKGVQQPGGVTAEPAQQRLAGRALDRELADSTELAAVPVDEIEIEDLGLAVESLFVPPRAAVEPPWHLLAQRHLPVPQRQEQIAHDPVRPREGRGTPGRQLRCTGPSAPGASARFRDVRRVLRRRRCRRSPRRRRATATSGNRTSSAPTPTPCRRRSRTTPADACGSAARSLSSTGSARLFSRLVGDTGDDGALGVQRPFGVAFTVRAAVHLEARSAAVSSGCNDSCTSREAFSGRMIGS